MSTQPTPIQNRRNLLRLNTQAVSHDEPHGMKLYSTENSLNGKRDRYQFLSISFVDGTSL